ncbi:DUF397 domain-containing protein [Streptomyces sp. NPDC023998]|uniref:DUF397 domain-containing protein n=1 Tax=Streptomyces sp. NPDC023998 TaxID=3154597 RepID=UPI0033F85403
MTVAGHRSRPGRSSRAGTAPPPWTLRQHQDLHGSTETAAHLALIRSSYGCNEGGACVEVATNEQTVLVRDSKDVSRSPVAVGRGGWERFVRYGPYR